MKNPFFMFHVFMFHSPMSHAAIQSLSPGDHVIIAGFGVPGRAVAEVLREHGMRYSVIELNSEISTRCARIGHNMVAGDVRQEATLLAAGLRETSLVILAIPSDAIVLEAVLVIRRLHPTVPIIARCNFISAGMQATQHGAQEVVVGEEIMAREMSRLVESRFLPVRQP
ncbi:MAG TPA: NAD(P)-binding protein [Tepidisphaeraceae bacterium]|jgi:voltage-gated potassium channel Kch